MMPLVVSHKGLLSSGDSTVGLLTASRTFTRTVVGEAIVVGGSFAITPFANSADKRVANEIWFPGVLS